MKEASEARVPCAVRSNSLATPDQRFGRACSASRPLRLALFLAASLSRQEKFRKCSRLLGREHMDVSPIGVTDHAAQVRELAPVPRPRGANDHTLDRSEGA